MANPVIATPLNEADFSIDGFSVAELDYSGKINLRADFESKHANQSLTKLLGIDCQLAPNTYKTSGDTSVFWLGPNERLVYTNGDVDAMVSQWRNKAGCAAVDVSDYSSVLKLSGPKARDVIASGTPFDIHPEVFSVGDCTQTRFGNATILLSNHSEAPEFQIQVRWSFAEYVFEYIKRVARYV